MTEEETFQDSFDSFRDDEEDDDDKDEWEVGGGPPDCVLDVGMMDGSGDPVLLGEDESC